MNQLLSRYDRFAISIQQQGRIIVQVTMMGLVETAPNTYSPRARGVLFVLKGPYDLMVKFSQESESARLTKIILSKSTVKTL